MDLEIGSIVSIDKQFYITAKVAPGGWNLIRLTDGQRYIGHNFQIRVDSNVVPNEEVEHFIQSNGLQTKDLKVLSSSLKSLLESKKDTKKSKTTPAQTAIAQERALQTVAFEEFRLLINQRYGAELGSPVQRIGNTVDVTIIAGEASGSLWRNVFSRCPDIMQETIIMNDREYDNYLIPIARLRRLLNGDYGRFP
jgi:hypothetical protein